ncbi:hypothetical protein C8C83_4382 [Flavobacterium sp. 90]|nr:hypothetical protein C8C82_4721 [Flavobacterium sp. 81]TCK56369.1 hypothetical protein C8C83_4382 [Flavobacterium sp. 90]
MYVFLYLEKFKGLFFYELKSFKDIIFLTEPVLVKIDLRSFGSIFFVLCPLPVVSLTNRIDPVSKLLSSPNEVSISTPPPIK